MRATSAFVLAAVVATWLAACASPPAARAPTTFTFVQLKTGAHTPATKEESAKVFAGHFANLQRLARERHLLVAGPYGKGKSDAALRGVFVLDTADAEQARRWAESDPGFVAGVFRFEFAPLTTTSDLRAQIAADLAREDAQKAAGKAPNPGDGMRGYVWLTAANGDAAAAAFASHAATLLVGRLDRGRTLVLLDAKDRAAAEAIVAPLRAQLGEVTLDEWMGTDLLVDLPFRSVV
jgi:uncharacterized protein YciI